MSSVAQPLITSRLNVSDVKKCCVLNRDSSYEALNRGISRSDKSNGCKKTCALMKSKRLKKY